MRPSSHSIYKILFGLLLVFLPFDQAVTGEKHQSVDEEATTALHGETIVSEHGSNIQESMQPVRPKPLKEDAEIKPKVLDAQPNKPSAPPDPNRRWIMKQRDYRNQGKKPKAREPLKWKNAAQNEKCQSRVRQLSATFEKAQFYSIQGDRCKTAQYARAFLEKTQECKTHCPQKFLEYNGFGHLVVRNMNQLKSLGTESCLGPQAKPGSKKAAHK